MKKLQTKRPFYLPRIGQRIVKTSIAVLITLLVYYLRGYRGADMPAEAAITAIICMQPYVHDTREYAVSRFIGTLIGAAWGLGFLLLMLVFPRMGEVLLIVYLRMAVGVMLTLYTCVLVRRPDTAGQAAIVFICVVIAFPEIEEPLQQALTRFDGVLLGTAAAILVNVFRLPRDKERSLVFFIKLSDLLPDRFSQLPAAALFRLNYLYNDGAKICIMSEHAPAFFTLSLSQAKLSVPFIVMDGAAIYDASENIYLQAETLEPAETEHLRAHLDALGLSYFLYTIHNGKICIFHQGEMRAQEQAIYENMKRSPYRSYLEGAGRRRSSTSRSSTGTTGSACWRRSCAGTCGAGSSASSCAGSTPSPGSAASTFTLPLLPCPSRKSASWPSSGRRSRSCGRGRCFSKPPTRRSMTPCICCTGSPISMSRSRSTACSGVKQNADTALTRERAPDTIKIAAGGSSNCLLRRSHARKNKSGHFACGYSVHSRR